MSVRESGPPIVLLSGPVGSGKTTLAESLVQKRGYKRLFTREAILRRLPDTPRTRVALQAAGERLDRETNGGWVADDLSALNDQNATLSGVVVDAVLIAEQVASVRNASSGTVLHVHLTAPIEELERRYSAKTGSIAESSRYTDLLQSETEAHVGDLASIADLVIDTATADLQHEVAAVLARLDVDAVQHQEDP